MPAEWESHEATWLSWPRREGISFPDAYEEVMPVFARMVEALLESEPLRINVAVHYHEQQARFFLKGIDVSLVEFLHIPTNEPWCRDHGPVFIKRVQ
jgi:agmatine deiminase